MRENEKLVNKICFFYSKDRYSMSIIAEKLKISPNKVRYWLGKHKIPLRDRSEAGYLAHMQRFNKFPAKIKKKFSLWQRELLISGIMLYWAEGWKNNNGYVAFSNSDPKMIQVFLKFLREICGVYESRLHILLHCYEGQDEVKLKKYWSEISGIPLSQFSASYIHRGKLGSYHRKSEYGTISLRYCDKKLLSQILQWIDDYFNRFVK